MDALGRRAVLGLALVVSCGATGPASAPASAPSNTRTFRMGFSSFPPRPNITDALRTIDSASHHSDAALMVIDVPWAALLADTAPAFLIRRDQFQLAQLYGQRGMPIAATLELADGINRAAESEVLVRLGRSITEPAVQRAYREYTVAFDSIVHPRYLALAMETNLMRSMASPKVYSAIVTMTNAAAQQLRAAGSTTTLMVSVQVETAWGRLGGSSSYVGIQRDRTDFPFVQALGLSSYPYLGGFTTPEQIPLDYYARLVADAPLPMLVVEGGWTSAQAGACGMGFGARNATRALRLSLYCTGGAVNSVRVVTCTV